jgi:hypothetical protein
MRLAGTWERERKAEIKAKEAGRVSSESERRVQLPKVEKDPLN